MPLQVCIHGRANCAENIHATDLGPEFPDVMAIQGTDEFGNTASLFPSLREEHQILAVIMSRQARHVAEDELANERLETDEYNRQLIEPCDINRNEELEKPGEAPPEEAEDPSLLPF